MNIRNCIAPAITLGVAITANAFVVDWDKIEHWAGNGDNRAALVVQFEDNGPAEAYVWGFRWNDADYPDGGPSGEDMFRGIVAGSSDLLLFTQYTGWMGSTVDGIGYFDPKGENLAASIAFDFDKAKEDARVSFDYFSPNELLNQTRAPGSFTPVYCKRAVDEAMVTRVIEHPINAREYGYPAYDYDWWQPVSAFNLQAQRWNAGWYDGYWSYWVGGTDSDELSYSGLGYTSRKLTDGQVDAWKYTLLDGPVTDWGGDGITGASTAWHQLNYSHFNSSVPTGNIEIGVTADSDSLQWFDLQGRHVANPGVGVYILRYPSGKTVKIIRR